MEKEVEFRDYKVRSKEVKGSNKNMVKLTKE